jgi:hypothetical protein
MSKTILVAEVTDSMRIKGTFPNSEWLFLKTKVKGYRCNFDIALPEYHGIKKGSKIKIVLED